VTKTFDQLQDVIEDAEFPVLDLALRRGFHVDRDSAAWYVLLSEGQDLLERFYRRYGCELIHKTDGYFYLLPTGEQLPRRQLSAQDMLVGQALALLYLDPMSLERGGIITREQVIEQLVAALGTAALMAAFLPKRRRKDEQVAQRQTRAKVGEAVRRLAALGFAELLANEQLRLRPALLRFAEPVRGLAEPAAALGFAELLANEQLRLRPALLRFAEPVRGLAEPAAALAQLVAQGEVALMDDELATGTQLDADGPTGEDETEDEAVFEADGVERDTDEAQP